MGVPCVARSESPINWSAKSGFYAQGITSPVSPSHTTTVF